MRNDIWREHFSVNADAINADLLAALRESERWVGKLAADAPERMVGGGAVLQRVLHNMRAAIMRAEGKDTCTARRRARSKGEVMSNMTVHIIMNDRGNPQGKLADAELHFADGQLAGLKLIGFSIWERRGGSGRNVTFPARQYSVNGERRSFALLRSIGDVTAQEAVRDAILAAYDVAVQEVSS